jgi:serine protease
VYVLHNRTGGSADNINSTYTVNLSSEALNGTWNLRVNDNASGDTGYINSWSVTF